MKIDWGDTYKVSGVYMIKNGNKIYIGFSSNMYTRLHNHQSLLNRGCHKNHYMQTDWNINPNSFEFAVVEKTTDSSREKYWIDYYETIELGYNMNYDGHHLYETRQKISNSVLAHLRGGAVS